MKALHSYLEKKTHVIWDWNGTLLRDIEHSVATTNHLLTEEGLPNLSVEHYKKIFRFPVIDYYRELGFDCSEPKFREICDRFNHHFHVGLEKFGLWPGARETLAHVKSLGKVQSILSASEQTLLRETVALFKLNELFDHVAGIHDKAAASKIARGHELMAAAGVPATQTILIGDTDHDLEVGNALGVDVILVEHGHQAAERLHRVHHTVLKIF